jgi:sugar phosphate isomerase/epimerase
MIYVSTSCIKTGYIKESVIKLAQQGLRNIELSGGTQLYEGYEKDLLDLQEKYSLNYLIHNYFPPPSNPFMLNLASLDDDLYYQSIEHCKRAIELSKILDGSKYGVHAGFMIDFTPQEAGKKISYREVNDREISLCRYSDAWETLTETAGSDVKLYIENNVYSATNIKTYGNENPFMLTCYDGFKELKNKVDFNLLLDLAHLKVSVCSQNLSYEDEINKLLPLTDYVHISGNDGLHDKNLSINSDEELMETLRMHDFSNKTITLEVYDGIDGVMKSYEVIERLCN